MSKRIETTPPTESGLSWEFSINHLLGGPNRISGIIIRELEKIRAGLGENNVQFTQTIQDSVDILQEANTRVTKATDRDFQQAHVLLNKIIVAAGGEKKAREFADLLLKPEVQDRLIYLLTGKGRINLDQHTENTGNQTQKSWLDSLTQIFTSPQLFPQAVTAEGFPCQIPQKTVPSNFVRSSGKFINQDNAPTMAVLSGGTAAIVYGLSVASIAARLGTTPKGTDFTFWNISLGIVINTSEFFLIRGLLHFGEQAITLFKQDNKADGVTKLVPAVLCLALLCLLYSYEYESVKMGSPNLGIHDESGINLTVALITVLSDVTAQLFMESLAIMKG